MQPVKWHWMLQGLRYDPGQLLAAGRASSPLLGLCFPAHVSAGCCAWTSSGDRGACLAALRSAWCFVLEAVLESLPILSQRYRFWEAASFSFPACENYLYQLIPASLQMPARRHGMSLLNPAMQFGGGKADVWLAVLCWEEITLQSILIV